MRLPALASCVITAILTASLGGCEQGTTPDVDTREATFEAVLEIFDQSGCATAGCHGGATLGAELDLDGLDVAHAQLVDVECANAEADSAGLLRVSSGDADESFLMTKLSMTSIDPTLGLPMPPTGDPLSARDLNLVRRWIDAGAPAADD
ncbi:MAG: hypothetical protein AAF721_30990 [Myxococcota bacterium]